jgi:[acyl-carrier-protein] S-malonyltransferase
MAKDLCERFPSARQAFAEADEALGFALSALCFDGPEAELKLTENTQPAILTASVAALRVLTAETSLRPAAVAGHSLGEYSALVAVGALKFRDAVKLVRARGRLMQQAVPPGAGAMAVVLGLEMDEVGRLCQDAAQGEVVAPANFNGGGQVVIAGAASAVARAVALAKQSGAKRVLDLPVSAPFHCALMRPAAEGLAQALEPISIHPFTVAVVTNVEAEANLSAERVKPLLVEQAMRPVRWEESARKLVSLGCTRAIEIGPGKVLKGLMKRIVPGLEVDSFETPADLAKFAGVAR